MNLLFFLQSINRTLSRVYAAHQYIIKNFNKTQKIGLSQAEIDLDLVTQNWIIWEYRSSLREFISMIRVSIDQFILLLSSRVLKYQGCDSIGSFLRRLEKYQNDDNYDIKFLSGLNATANYLKHHPYQFEGPESCLHLHEPALLIICDEFKRNNKRNYDYDNLLKYYGNEVQFLHNNSISCSISCNFFVKGFDAFYKQIKQHKLS